MGASDELFGFRKTRQETGLRPSTTTSSLDRTDSKLAAARQNGQRLRDEMRNQSINPKLGEQALMQLRELLVGPAQREAEERFTQLLDILEQHDSANRGRMQSLESGLQDLSEEAKVLREDYEALGQRIERVLQLAEHEKHAVQTQFSEAARMLQEEFESKVYALSKTVQDTLRRADAEAERAINALVKDVHVMRKETHELLHKAETTSMAALEQRISKWRAEIEQSRAEDLESVANSLVGIGEKLLSGRR